MSKAAELEKIIVPILESRNFELVDVRYLSEAGNRLVRVFVENVSREKPVTLGDCGSLSEIIGAAIDDSGLINHSYCLEVSSPGIDRVLKKAKDFTRFKGKKVKVTTYAPMFNDAEKSGAVGQRHFTGIIIGYENDVLIMELDDKTQTSIVAKNIANARLVPEV